MAVTHKHLGKLFANGWSMQGIANRYKFPLWYVENAIRRVIWRKK